VVCVSSYAGELSFLHSVTFFSSFAKKKKKVGQRENNLKDSNEKSLAG
jgi:hypothetical protein